MNSNNVYSIFTGKPVTEDDLSIDDEGNEHVMTPEEKNFHEVIHDRRILYTEQLVKAATVASDPNLVPTSAFVLLTIDGNPVPVVSFANSDIMYVPQLINFLEMNIQALRTHYARAVVGHDDSDADE